MSLGSLVVLVVGVFVGAVSERHQLERDVLDFFAVGVVRTDVGDEAQLVLSFVEVGVSPLFKRVLALFCVGFGYTLVVVVPKVGVGGSLESEDAEGACALVWAVSLIDGDIGSIASVVGMPMARRS